MKFLQPILDHLEKHPNHKGAIIVVSVCAATFFGSKIAGTYSNLANERETRQMEKDQIATKKAEDEAFFAALQEGHSDTIKDIISNSAIELHEAECLTDNCTATLPGCYETSQATTFCLFTTGTGFSLVAGSDAGAIRGTIPQLESYYRSRAGLSPTD